MIPSMEYRRIFTPNDRRAWNFVCATIPEPDGEAFMSNAMMADQLGLREAREGSRLYRRLEEFGLIVSRQVRHPETHSLCRKVWRNDMGVTPAFVERSAMVVIREVPVEGSAPS